jgi:hypothetical protein
MDVPSMTKAPDCSGAFTVSLGLLMSAHHVERPNPFSANVLMLCKRMQRVNVFNFV